MTLIDETDFLHGEYVRVDPMTRTEQIGIVGELNVRYGTDVPIAVIELAIVLGFTTWEQLRREVAKPDPKCDHKFISSDHCLKCGWTPTPDDFKRAAGG
jgi:hypothetical protein